jgi:hypothetical protein
MFVGRKNYKEMLRSWRYLDAMQGIPLQRFYNKNVVGKDGNLQQKFILL